MGVEFWRLLLETSVFWGPNNSFEISYLDNRQIETPDHISSLMFSAFPDQHVLPVFQTVGGKFLHWKHLSLLVGFHAQEGNRFKIRRGSHTGLSRAVHICNERRLLAAAALCTGLCWLVFLHQTSACSSVFCLPSLSVLARFCPASLAKVVCIYSKWQSKQKLPLWSSDNSATFESLTGNISTPKNTRSRYQG